MLHDVYTFQDILEPEQNISCDAACYHNWPFQFYMLRYNEVYLERSPRTLPYYVVEKGNKPHEPGKYRRLQTETVRYDLYERIE